MGDGMSDGSYCNSCGMLKSDCRCCYKCRKTKCEHPTRHGIVIPKTVYLVSTDRPTQLESVIGIFEKEQDAKRLQDTSMDLFTHNVMVWGSFDAFKEARDETIKRRALEKLTTEERRVLGLKADDK